MAEIIKIWDSKNKKAIQVEIERQSGNESMALCPFHDDTKPSLAINLIKELYYCHSCSAKGVLYDPEYEERFQDQNITDIYNYEDIINEDKKLLYQVLRLKNKKFLCRRSNGKNWIYNLHGIRRVLYRLPELIQCPKNKIVFVVEGEKDVDRLIEEGFKATTNSHGAGKWKEDYNESFQGRSIVLVPDNDDKGRDYCQDIINNLKGITKEIRLLELPGLGKKEDISDWFDKGGTAEELKKLVVEAPVVYRTNSNDTTNQDKKNKSKVMKKFSFNDIEISGKDFVTNYCNYACSITDGPRKYQKILALSIIATALNGKVYIPSGVNNLYPNLFVVLIGKSTIMRKTVSLGIAKDLISNINEDLIFPSDFTQEGFFELLKDKPKGIVIWSEFGGFLNKANKNYMSGTKEFLTSAFDCPKYIKKKLAGKEVFGIENPYINIITATNMIWFVNNIGEGDIMGGFLGRFIYVPSLPSDKDRWYPKTQKPDIKTKNDLVLKLKTISDLKGEAAFSPDAAELHIKWLKHHERELEKIPDSKGISGFYGRLADYLLKFSLLFEISNNYILEVSVNSIKRAIQLIESLKNSVKNVLDKHVSFSKEEKNKKRVLNIISENKRITKSDLLKTTGFNKKTLDPILETLIEEESIDLIRDGKFKPANTYFIKEDS